MYDNDISGYVNRKNGNGSKYNFDLKPLIENFSFKEFISNAFKNKEIANDYGGFLVITNRQYIIGYNAGFGGGAHISSFARTMLDLKGGGMITLDKDALYLNRICKNNFITARIMYECTGESENRTPIYSGSISFSLESLPITKAQFKVFKKFYEDYNKEIESVIRQYSLNNFCVWLSYKDENGKYHVDKSNNLDNLYNFLESQIDENKQIYEEEVILGVEVPYSKKKL